MNTDPEGLISYAGTHPEQFSGQPLQKMLDWGSFSDPALALRALRSGVFKMDEAPIDKAVATIDHLFADGALPDGEFYPNQPANLRDAVIRYREASRDPEACLASLEGAAPQADALTSCLLKKALNTLAAQNPGAALSWLSRLPAIASNSYDSYWAIVDSPAATAQDLEKILSPSYSGNLKPADAKELAYDTARNLALLAESPQDYFATGDRILASAPDAQTAAALASSMARQFPVETMEFIQNLGDEAQRDAASVGFVRALVSYEATSGYALEASLNIQDPKLRISTMEQLISKWTAPEVLAGLAEALRGGAAGNETDKTRLLTRLESLKSSP
jgi:hypothetical protein